MQLRFAHSLMAHLKWRLCHLRLVRGVGVIRSSKAKLGADLSVYKGHSNTEDGKYCRMAIGDFGIRAMDGIGHKNLGQTFLPTVS